MLVGRAGLCARGRLRRWAARGVGRRRGVSAAHRRAARSQLQRQASRADLQHCLQRPLNIPTQGPAQAASPKLVSQAAIMPQSAGSPWPPTAAPIPLKRCPRLQYSAKQAHRLTHSG